MLFKEFSRKLISWYGQSARNLPWRRTNDPYRIWISEIMLQQTTVRTVIPYYQRWVTVFPTIQSVSNAPLQKVLKQWQGLGYYLRARNIHKTAKIICQNHEGKMPNNADKLKRLPGFGPYTVGAVLSIAFNQKYPVIDANVRRVIMRILAMPGYAESSKDQEILRFLKRVMPARHAGIFNQALMELGALICRSRNPLCLACPLRIVCRGYKRGIQEIIPRPKKRVVQEISVSIGIIQRGNKYFIQKRPPFGLFADLWEFPGGKIKKGETKKQTLRRELKEEIGVEIESFEHFMDTRHFYTQFRAKLHVFFCKPMRYPKQDKSHRWVALTNLLQYPMPSGSAKIVDQIVARTAKTESH